MGQSLGRRLCGWVVKSQFLSKEELAEGPSVDPDSRSIAGFLGPFEGTATSAFDDINEEAYEVENAAACAQMCAGMKDTADALIRCQISWPFFSRQLCREAPIVVVGFPP